MPKAFQQRDMSGSLFAQKVQRGKGPAMTGSITIGGVRYRLAAWWREPVGGALEQWLSIAAGPWDEAEHGKGRRPGEDVNDDAIPF